MYKHHCTTPPLGIETLPNICNHKKLHFPTRPFFVISLRRWFGESSRNPPCHWESTRFLLKGAFSSSNHFFNGVMNVAPSVQSETPRGKITTAYWPQLYKDGSPVCFLSHSVTISRLFVMYCPKCSPQNVSGEPCINFYTAIFITKKYNCVYPLVWYRQAAKFLFGHEQYLAKEKGILLV